MEWQVLCHIHSRTAGARSGTLYLYGRGNTLDSLWESVGSSSYAHIHVSTVLFHGALRTTTARGARVVLDLARQRAGSLWITVITCLALAVAGSLHQEELGDTIVMCFCAAWAASHIALASSYWRAGQNDSAVVYALLALMQAGNLALIAAGHWVETIAWYGAVSTFLAVVIYPFPVAGHDRSRLAVFPCAHMRA